MTGITQNRSSFHFQFLVEGYRTVRSLSQQEIDLIPKFIDFACLRFFFWIKHHEALHTFHNDAIEKIAQLKQWTMNRICSNTPDSAVEPSTGSFRIQPFESKYQADVIALIEKIQVGEFDLPIEEGQRKELRSIAHSFQKDKGNYWIALLNEKVIGTIAVIDIGHHAFELRDVFLDKDYRGGSRGFAKQLLDTVFAWSKAHDVTTLYLGTTLRFRAAHRFYEKHGFREIARLEMPPYCQPMECDEKFYRFDLSPQL